MVERSYLNYQLAWKSCMNSIQIQIKISIPSGAKVPIKDRLNPRKYQILTDGDRVITWSRKHIKGYVTKSGRISKTPDRFGSN